MSGHTPGPWAMNPFSARVDALPSRVPVCELLWPTEQRSEEETVANGRLVASAPDLLRALQDIVYRAGDESGRMGESVITIANRAIHKALGANHDS